MPMFPLLCRSAGAAAHYALRSLAPVPILQALRASHPSNLQLYWHFNCQKANYIFEICFYYMLCVPDIAARRRFGFLIARRLSYLYISPISFIHSICSPRRTTAAILTPFGTQLHNMLRCTPTKFRLDRGICWSSTGASFQQSLGVPFWPYH